jgi:hypothetical protein
MTEPIAVTRDRFDRLLAEWQLNEDRIGRLQDQQGDTAETISQLFSDIITRDQLLAGLPWEIEYYPHETSMFCNIKDEKAAEFLKKMIWKDFKYYWSGSIKVGGNVVNVNDGEITIYFEKGIDDLLSFCQIQGIKPVVTTLNDQRKKAQDKADGLTRLIESLS